MFALEFRIDETDVVGSRLSEAQMVPKTRIAGGLFVEPFLERDAASRPLARSRRPKRTHAEVFGAIRGAWLVADVNLWAAIK